MPKKKRKKCKKSGNVQNHIQVRIVNLLKSDLAAASKMLDVKTEGLRKAINDTDFLNEDLLSLSVKKFDQKLRELIVRASIHELNAAGLTDIRVNARGFVEGRILINPITGKRYD